jgi:hypothetical protein
MLLSIELMLLAVNLKFLVFSVYLDAHIGCTQHGSAALLTSTSNPLTSVYPVPPIMFSKSYG